ncbi:BN159_2729 family protein [Streptomyces sp. NPDC059477]|uniref:BN159_2729 family protein n=1 Tax=Streptomyces sp. NPDC059477 TaxID=3346847 RepID=UPI00368BA87E
MNRNLPQAIALIRNVAGCSETYATTLAHELNKAGLLTDPERYGVVLHRTGTGAWSRDPQPPMTDLERQAIAWDQSCERARKVAASLQEQLGGHPEYQAARADGDRVLVGLHITSQAQWAAWRTFFGITHDGEKPLPYAVTGDGYRDGVRVSVVAYDVPQVRARATEVAARPYRHEGVVYDLALPQRDAGGDVWFFHGETTPAGMPLLVQDGRPEHCSLANAVIQAGPLTAVRTTATPVTPQGGDPT